MDLNLLTEFELHERYTTLKRKHDQAVQQVDFFERARDDAYQELKRVQQKLDEAKLVKGFGQTPAQQLPAAASGNSTTTMTASNSYEVNAMNAMEWESFQWNGITDHEAR